MKIIQTQKFAQMGLPARPRPASTPPVVDEGLNQPNTGQPVAPGATGQPAAVPANGQGPQAPQGSQMDGPQVEPSDPDAQLEQEENELFPQHAQPAGGNARPDVYPKQNPTQPSMPNPLTPRKAPMNADFGMNG